MDIDLDEAAQLFVADFKSNFLPSLHDDDVLGANEEALVQHLKRRLSNYHAAPLRLATVPKPRLRVRLGGLPTLPDWVLYNAAVVQIARTVEGSLIPPEQQVLFSFRWNEDEPLRMFRSKHLPHEHFKEKCVDLLEQFPLVQTTDLVDYFEHIDLGILRETLLRLGADPELVEFLIDRLLRHWTHPSGRGIPQGPWASSYLGNVYLDALDKTMIQRGFTYVRYVDDIRVFCRSPREARRAIMSLAEVCRELGLSLQSEKTNFLSSKTAREIWVGLERKLEEMQEDVAERLRKYFVHIGVYGEESAEEIAPDEDEVLADALHSLFDDLTKSKPAFRVNGQSLRFTLNRLGALNDDYALEFCLESHSAIPEQAQTVSRYLLHFIDDVTVQSRVLEFLKSEDNLYAWQATHLLSLFPKAPQVLDEIVSYSRSTAADLNADFALRAAAVDTLGAHGSEDDVRELRRHFASEASEDVKIAIILACQRLHPEERKRFLDSCRGISVPIDGAAKLAVSAPAKES